MNDARQVVTAGPAAGAGAGGPGDRAAAAMTIIRLFRTMERVDAGLTPQQYRMLKLVGDGGERSARLAERLAVAKPTLTATADGLVAAGLLSRATEVADRRVVRLCLTPEGQAAIDRAEAAYAGWLDALLAAAGEPDRPLRDLALLDAGLDLRWRARHGATAAAATSPVPAESA
ncbi:MAG: MarR family winged helix-turn-helix transcriptional regulator [Streptosporangiaceae bacterium]